MVQEPQRLAFALLGGAEARNENENERRVFEDGIRSGRSESPERAPTSAAEWLFNFRPIEWLGSAATFSYSNNSEMVVFYFFDSVRASIFILRTVVAYVVIITYNYYYYRRSSSWLLHAVYLILI